MKKLMLSSMILLPLILLLILSLSTAFVSMTTYVYVEKIQILDSEETIYLYKESDDMVPTFKLETNIFPMLASNKNIIFSSKNEDVATINDEGVISGVNFGETYVMVEAEENKAKYATRKVVVTDDKVHKINVEKKIGKLYTGETYQLKCTVVPDKANDKTLIFSSSNTDVAEVSSFGKITAKAFGTTIISIKSRSNPEVLVEFELAVMEELVNVTLDGDTSTVLLESSTSKFPTIVLHPVSAKAHIEYSSSNEDIATVDTKGNITFNKAGSVIIKATVGSKYVFEKEYRFTDGYVQNVTILSESEYKYEDYIDKPTGISIDTLPKNIDAQNLAVSFSNDKVLYMDENKKFFIKGGGSVVVTVTYKTSANETKQISKTINVTRKVEDIVINNIDGLKGTVFYSFDNVFKINSQKSPIDSTFDVTYSTTTKGVSIQDDKVIFPQVDYLEATIIASTNNGELTKEFKVIYANPTKDKLEKFEVKKGKNDFNLIMPQSAKKQEVSVVFYVVKDNLNSVEILDDTNKVSVVVATNIGNKQYKVKVNNEDYAMINFTITRKVEKIENVTYTEKETGNKVELKNDILYTSQKDIVISYDLYPLNTTITKAIIYEKDNSATILGNVISFQKAGIANFEIKADDIIYKFQIYSTFTHPDNDTVVISEKVVNKGEIINFNDIVTKVSPTGADNKFITLTSESANLKAVSGGFEALYGGDSIVTVRVDTDKGIITKQVNIKVLENAESIKLNKNYFVVNSSTYTIDKADYNILPISANNGLNAVITVDKGEVKDNTITFGGSSVVKATITLANGVSADMYILFAGSTKVVEFNDNVVEMEKGSKFIAKIPDINSVKYDGVKEINGLTYDSGIFTVTDVILSESDLNSGSFTIGGKTFKVKGIIKAKGITITPNDINQLDKVSNGYVTALTNVKLNGKIVNDDATYKGVKFSSLNEQIATVDSSGNVTFNKAGKVQIVASSTKDSTITASITIRSTMGLVDYIDVLVKDINIDYDKNKSVNLVDSIKVFPSQASKDNIKLDVNNKKVQIDGLIITALEGGNALVSASYKLADGSYKLASTISVNIVRKATGISVNGEELNSNKAITIDSAYINLEVVATPVDANKDTYINIEIIQGSENAFKQNGKLIFVNNGEVKVRFTLNTVCTYVITYNNIGDLTPVIDVDSDVVVVPYEVPVKFKSTSGAKFTVPLDVFTLVSGSADKYKASRSVKSTIEVGGALKTLVVTKNVASSDIYVYDYNNSLKAEEKRKLNSEMLLTASSKIKIEAGMIDAFNADGSQVEVELNVINSDVATINGGYLVFNKMDIAKVKATISGVDYFGAYTREQVFEVASTMGTAMEYTVNAPTKLVDTYSFNLQDQINVSMPKYGGNNVKFELTANDVFKVNGFNVEVVKTGYGELIVTTNGKNKNVFNIKVDQSVETITFNHKDTVIVADYTNSNNYLINAICKATKFEPTLTNLTYKLVGEGATISGNELTFSSDYAVVSVMVIAESGATATLKVIKVASDVKVVDIVDDSPVVVSNTAKYVFDIIGKDFTDNIVNDSNITIINKLTGSIKFNHGGNKYYDINGQKVNFIITESVDKVEVKVNELLTAQSVIDLNATLNPTIIPATSYSELGEYKVSYNLVSGSASIVNGVLTFNGSSVAVVEVMAGDKKAVVTIESTNGYVKSIAFDKQYEAHFKDNSIVLDGYTVLPTDVDSSKYSFSILDTSVASISGNTIVFNHCGITKVVATYQTALNESKTAESKLIVHNPVEVVNFTYKGNIVNRIVVNKLPYQLEYDIDDSNALIDDISFIGDSVASVTKTGLVTTFSEINKVAVITIVIKNSDGTLTKKSVELMVTDRIIKEFGANIQETASCEVDYNKEYYLYVLPIDGKAISYEVTSGKDVLTINDGYLTILKGGKAVVKINGSSNVTTINIDVYKKTIGIDVPNVSGNNVFTANKQANLSATLIPIDSATNKVVDYYVDNNAIASISGSKLTFNTAGTVNVTISVKYKGEVETSKVITIRSTFGEIESFEVVDSEGTLKDEYIFTDSGESKKFSIVNIMPADYQLSNFVVDTQGVNTLKVQSVNNEFTLTSVDKGQGSINVTIGHVSVSINYNAKLKIKSITATLNNIDVVNGNEYLTMEDELLLKYLFYPLNANTPEGNAKAITWTIDNGATIDVTTGKITLPNYAVYTLQGTSFDGGAKFTITIEKINKFNSFKLKYGNNEVSSSINDVLQINPAYNEASMALQITGLPSNFIGKIKQEFINVTVSQGITYLVKGNEVTINIPTFTEETPTFKGNVVVKIGEAFVKANIYRDGIKEIIFVGHDNNKDIEYGLQQVRLFGTRSYYNGKLVNYYDMPFSILPANSGKNLVLTTSDPRVMASIVDNSIRVDFGNFVGNSNVDIQNNIFNKVVTVTATDASGKISYSYTFHMVGDGGGNIVVNVFDQQGFLLNEKIVLQVNLGGTEEQSFSNYSPLTYDKNINDSNPGINNPALKTIYGNGNTINFYAYNDTFVENKDNKQDRYQIKINEMYNLKTKGGNMDKKKKNYNIFFSGVKQAHYCVISQGFRGLRSEGDSTFKNCSFRYLLQTAIMTTSWASPKIKVENILLVDGGFACMDLLCEHVYIKGFIDSYNYQNADGMSTLLPILPDGIGNLLGDIVIKDFKKYHKEYGLQVRKNTIKVDNYLNTVIFIDRSVAKRFFDIKFYDEAVGDYVTNPMPEGSLRVEVGTSSSAPGLTRLRSNTRINIPGVVNYSLADFGDICTYKPDSKYSWAHQNDFDYLAKQEQKVYRTYDGSLD